MATSLAFRISRSCRIKRATGCGVLTGGLELYEATKE